MRRSTYFLFLIVFSALTILACEKEEAADQTIEVTLKNSEDYSYDFKISGDEEGVTITKQAEHYETSELFRGSSTNFNIVYYYKPEAGFKGNDSVEFELCTGGAGTACTLIETLQINFTIKDE